MPHPWRHSQSGWTGLWAPDGAIGISVHCRAKWPLRISYNSNGSKILWFHDSTQDSAGQVPWLCSHPLQDPDFLKESVWSLAGRRPALTTQLWAGKGHVCFSDDSVGMVLWWWFFFSSLFLWEFCRLVNGFLAWCFGTEIKVRFGKETRSLENLNIWFGLFSTLLAF